MSSSDQILVQLHSTYGKREGRTYTKLLRYALYLAHRLTPDVGVLKQRELIEFGERNSFDGLESLWLVYQDCVAATDDCQVLKARMENAKLLKEVFKFKDPPAPQLAQRVTQWNSLIERGVRSEAVRVVMEQFVALPPESSANMNYSDLMQLES